MYRKNKKKIFLFVLSFIFSANTAMVFAASESANFTLIGGQVNMLAGSPESASFGSEVGGSPGAGNMTSANFGVRPGSSFSIPPTAAAAAAPTLGGGGGFGGGADVSGPKISALQVTDVAESQVRVIFTTDEPAVTYLEYGPADEFNLVTAPEISFFTDHNFLLYNLLPNTRYKFIVHLRDLSNNKSKSIIYDFQTAKVFKAVPNPSRFVAGGVTGAISLAWKNPVLTDFGGVKLVRSSVYYPTDLNGGVLLFDGQTESYIDTVAVPGQKYYYTLFAYDTSFNYSSGAIAAGESLPGPPSLEVLEGQAPTEGEVGPEEEIEGVPPEEVIPPETLLPEAPELEIIVPARPPELPVGLTPVEAETRVERKLEIDRGILNFFGLVKQYIAQGYEKLTRIFSGLVADSIRQVNNIKDGLITATGEVSREIYERLTPVEKARIEQIIAQPLPPVYEAAAVNKIFADFLGASVERVNQIKAGLVDATGRLQQDVYEQLTKEEKAQIEQIIAQPLPPTFEYNSIVQVSPMSLEAAEAGADWHIFADSDSLLTISAAVFDKPVATIVVTIRAEAYILKYNPTTGNYETVIRAPSEKGLYQMIIQVIYMDNTFDEFKRAVLVDPYGYVYAERYQPWSWKKPWQIFGTEAVRVSGAKITLYTLNKVDEWVIWPGNLYNQPNPQTSNRTGEFLFVVPAGRYYLTAEAIGYKKFVGKSFTVAGEIINLNFKLNDLFSWPTFIPALFRWGVIIILPLLALGSLVLWGVHIGIKLGMRKVIDDKIGQSKTALVDNQNSQSIDEEKTEFN